MKRLVFEFFFDLFASSDVGIDAEDGCRQPKGVELQRPTAGDDDGCAVTTVVHELALPVLVADQLGVDLSQRTRKGGVEDRLRGPPEDLSSAPAVQGFGAAIPEADRPAGYVPDNDRVVREIQELRLLPELDR